VDAGQGFTTCPALGIKKKVKKITIKINKN
jgi:hypothetical protein